MFRVFLAARYVLSRRVSYLGMASIALAVGALIVVISVMNGFLGETRKLVRGTTADVIVLPMQDTGSGPPAARAALEKLVAAQPGVVGAVARLVRPAMVKKFGGSDMILNLTQFSELSFVTVLGIDPAAEKPVSGLGHYLDQVEDPSLRVADPERPFAFEARRIQDAKLRTSRPPTCLVGEDRMDVLGLRPGDALNFVTLPDGEQFTGDKLNATTQTFVVAGAFRTKHHEFDMSSVFVERDAFLDWTGTRTEVSELYVRVEDGKAPEVVRDGLKGSLTRAGIEAQVETWKDRHKVYLGAVENERNILAFVLSLFVLLTCTITFSMLTMMVQEKVRDIGILSAMGASSSGIGAIFAAAGATIAAGGALLGLLAGEAVARNVNAVKDWIESTFGIQIFRRDVYAFTDVPSVVDERLNLAVAGVTVVFALVICLIPAMRAARLDPVEALRHD